MEEPPGDRWARPRRAWIALCSGWWLAGVVAGAGHFLELWGRPRVPVLQLIGVPLASGSFLPGAVPVFAAAELLGRSGLPIGFTGIALGAALGLTVWLSLPPVLYWDGRDRPNRARTALVAAVPYVAGGVGLLALFRAYRTPDREDILAAGMALAAATVAYLSLGAILFVVGIGLLWT